MLQLLIVSLAILGIFGAWVSGALDPYQKRLQESVLDAMGETKVSYGLKKSLAGKKLIEDENLSKIQDRLGADIGGIFGKGGVGHDLGAGLSKNL